MQHNYATKTDRAVQPGDVARCGHVYVRAEGGERCAVCVAMVRAGSFGKVNP